MGKKKQKDRGEEDADAAPSSDVFKTLFGDVCGKNELVSIFSDANPFKRKLKEIDVGRGDFDGGGGAEGDVKKRKVEKDGSGAVEEGGSVANDVRKVKKKGVFVDSAGEKGVRKVEEKSGGAGDDDGVRFSRGDDRVNYDAGDKGNSVGKFGEDEDKRGRKKRKRDDLERLYEAKRYGETEEDETGNVKSSNEKITGKKRKKADDVAEMSISKEEGFDDEIKLLRTVFVGNLPLKVKKKALVKEFSKFGEIESVRIRSVPLLDTKIPRKGAVIKKKINDAIDCVHAYVVFKAEESAQASLAHNMAVVGGNHIRVDRACPPRKKMKGEGSLIYDNKRTVFVGNLPFDVKDEEIYRLFSGISNLGSGIEAVRVVRDPHTSLGKGIAYVLFKTMDAVNLVLKKRNLKLRDRDLRLSHTKLNSTPAKRSNPATSAGSNSPAKKLAFNSSFSNRESKPNKTVSMSYQGLQATKADTRKNLASKVVKPGKFKKEGSQERGGLKQRTKKRPAVAARKAKALVLKEFGSVKKTDRKRKSDARTPGSIHQNKKIKKFE